MEQQYLLALIDKYLEGNASEEEINLLHRYYEGFQETNEWNEAALGDSKETGSKIYQRLMEAIRRKQ